MDNETNEDLRNILRRLLSANEVLDHEAGWFQMAKIRQKLCPFCVIP